MSSKISESFDMLFVFCSIFFPFLKVLLKYSLVIIMYEILLYNRMIHLYMYTHPFSFKFFSLCHKILGRILCATQQVPIIPVPQCAHANPKLLPPVHPSLPPVPFGNHKFVFKVCESLSLLSHLYLFFSFYILHVSGIIWYLPFFF